MNYIYKLMVFASALLLAACTADELELTENTLPQGGEKLELTVGMPNESGHSRIAFDDANPKPKLNWEEGDGLYLVGYDDTDAFKGTSIFALTDGKGTASGKFSGYTVEGATRYAIYYHAENLSIGTDGAATMNYENQTQTAATSTQHLKGYLFLSTPDKVSLASLKAGSSAITLTLQNSLVRFNITKKPETLTQLSALTWVTQESETADHLLRLNLTGDACTASAISAYFAFDPATTKLGQGQKMYLTFEGNETYTVEAVSTNGKNYEAGKRYHLEVTTDESIENTLHTWTQLVQHDTEIWVETTNKQKPRDITSYDSAEKIAGTTLWKFHKTDDSDITAIEDNLFENNGDITRIILPAKVTTIGSYAFFQSAGLKEANLPEGVETIGANAFAYCPQLTKANLPASLTSIGGNAFDSAEALSDLTISVSDKLTTIGEYIFDYVRHITKVTVNTSSAKALDVVNCILPTRKADLYLDQAWYEESSTAKPSGNTWNGKNWKSITKITSAP